MQKIMFNDAYGLTRATIEGRKTMTRRLMNPQPQDCSESHKGCWGADWANEPMRLEYDEKDNGFYCIYCGYGVNWDGSGYFLKPAYKVGEVVAVAQRYADIPGMENMTGTPGWRNKMFTKAELMPYRIRITGIKAERLQDISDEDCLREGIFFHEYTTNHEKRRHYGFDGFLNGSEGWFARGWYNTPREAFAALIDKVSGRGTWTRNPWVVAYEYELIKWKTMKKIETIIKNIIESCKDCDSCQRFNPQRQGIGSAFICGRTQRLITVAPPPYQFEFPHWCPLETYKETASTSSTAPQTVILPGLPNLEWMTENLSGYGGTEIDGRWYYTYDEAVEAVK